MPRKTMTTRAVQNKAINILFEMFEPELSSSKLAGIFVSKILNKIVQLFKAIILQK
jgi:Zn-dependent M32 family carboxypeptidase